MLYVLFIARVSSFLLIIVSPWRMCLAHVVTIWAYNLNIWPIITREEINLWILDCGLSRKWSFEITFSLGKALTYQLVIYWVWEGFCITYWSNLILSYCVWVLAVVLHRAKVHCEHMLIIIMVQCTIDMIWFCPNSREFTLESFQWREEMYWWGRDELFYIAWISV